MNIDKILEEQKNKRYPLLIPGDFVSLNDGNSAIIGYVSYYIGSVYVEWTDWKFGDSSGEDSTFRLQLTIHTTTGSLRNCSISDIKRIISFSPLRNKLRNTDPRKI